jgi:hypothetical protein
MPPWLIKLKFLPVSPLCGKHPVFKKKEVPEKGFLK